MKTRSSNHRAKRNENRVAKAIIARMKMVDDMSRREAAKPEEDRAVALDKLNPLRCSRGLCECNEATNSRCAYRAALLAPCACWGNAKCLYHKHTIYCTPRLRRLKSFI